MDVDARGCGSTFGLEEHHPSSSPRRSQHSCFVLPAVVLSRLLLPAFSNHFTLFIPYPVLSLPSRLLALSHCFGNEVSATARNAGRSVSPFFGREHLRIRCHTQGGCMQRTCRSTSCLRAIKARLIIASGPLATEALRSELW